MSDLKNAIKTAAPAIPLPGPELPLIPRVLANTVGGAVGGGAAGGVYGGIGGAIGGGEGHRWEGAQRGMKDGAIGGAMLGGLGGGVTGATQDLMPALLAGMINMPMGLYNGYSAGQELQRPPAAQQKTAAYCLGALHARALLAL